MISSQRLYFNLHPIHFSIAYTKLSELHLFTIKAYYNDQIKTCVVILSQYSTINMVLKITSRLVIFCDHKNYMFSRVCEGR